MPPEIAHQPEGLILGFHPYKAITPTNAALTNSVIPRPLRKSSRKIGASLYLAGIQDTALPRECGELPRAEKKRRSYLALRCPKPPSRRGSCLRAGPATP